MGNRSVWQRLTIYLISIGALANLAAFYALSNEPSRTRAVLSRFTGHLASDDTRSPMLLQKAMEQFNGLLIATNLSEEVPGNAQTTAIPDTGWVEFKLAAQSQHSFPYQSYTATGKPSGMRSGAFLPPRSAHYVSVRSTKELLQALDQAKPGDIIEPAPGIYRITARSIPIDRGGTRSLPIYLRADYLGSVSLVLETLEGFHVKAPYWVFENLDIVGACGSDSSCEHAFHVVGSGASFVLRNSRLQEFNAPVKVNLGTKGAAHAFPDYGLLEYNEIANSRVRQTDNPVNLININAADGWVVRGNLIADFAKGSGNRVSFGAYMKGNGHDGIFERNLVICEKNVPDDGGVRLGLSFGGGGTGKKYCRNQDCSAEHTGGIMRNNVILNCSRDVGIYLNRASYTQVYNNVLYNNLGIDVRFESSTAVITNNLVSGRIKSRNGGEYNEKNNLVDAACFGPALADCTFHSIYANPAGADLRLMSIENPIWNASIPLREVTDDLCGHPRGDSPDIGPIQYSMGLDCLHP